jgi:YD repeat-containing protein
MTAIGINHISIHANDLEESVKFYETIFGMKRIPTAKFAAPAIWLKLGSQQLHIFKREGQASRFQHLAINVDDFMDVYVKARELGVIDGETIGAPVREHPSGWVQMYLRDPSGNLVEVDWPDSSTLDRSVVADVLNLNDLAPQTGEAAIASLFYRE